MHKFFKKSLNTVQDFVANPKVHQVSQLVNSALKIASTVAQAKIGGPIAVVGGVVAGIDVLQETFGIEKPDPIKVFLEAHGMVGKTSSIPKIIVELKADRFLPMQALAKNSENTLTGFCIDGEYIAWQKTTKTQASDIPANTSSTVYITPGFELKKISQAIGAALEHPIIVASLHTVNGMQRIKLDASPYSDIQYLGVNDPASFSDEIEKFHQKGISRAALLWGLPGSGKTSYLKNYAKIANKSLLLVPPELVNDIGSRGELSSLIELIRPDILVLDDLDWIGETALSILISKVDEWRQRFPKTVLVATCNRISNGIAPLLRPGRLGKTLHFNTPSAADKAEVFSYYLEKYGVSSDKINVSALISEMKHPCFTQDYVRFVAEEAVVLNQKQLVESIKRLNLHLKMTQKTDGGDDGYFEEEDPLLDLSPDGTTPDGSEAIEAENSVDLSPEGRTIKEALNSVRIGMTVPMVDGSRFNIDNWTLLEIQDWAMDNYLGTLIHEETFYGINKTCENVLNQVCKK